MLRALRSSSDFTRFATAASRILFVRATNPAFFCHVKSVSQLSATTAAKLPSFLASTQPSAALRSSRFGGYCLTLLAEDLDCSFDVTVCLGECFFAIHQACRCEVAQLGDFCHCYCHDMECFFDFHNEVVCLRRDGQGAYSSTGASAAVSTASSHRCGAHGGVRACSGGFFIFSSSCSQSAFFYLALCEAFCHCGANGIED